MPFQWRTRGGRGANPRGVGKKCMKMKEIGPTWVRA